MQGVRLEKARLLRANFSAADVRDGKFAAADFTLADLHSANFRRSSLEQVSFQGANLDDSDLTGADLTRADLTDASLVNTDLTRADLNGVHWEHVANLKNANIFGVKNAPRGFVEWAIQHGAQQQDEGAERPAQMH